MELTATLKALDDATSGRRRFLRGGTALLAIPTLGLGGCATTTAPTGPVRQFEQPRVRVGDIWQYREINRFNQLPLADVEVAVTSAAPLTCRVRRTRSNSTAGEIARHGDFQEERYASPWAVGIEPTYDLVMNFAEPMPILPVSLQAGQSDSRTTSYTVNGFSGRFRWQQRLAALGTERVSTPAGTFECLRVRRMIWFQHPDLFRFNSARIDTVWYAAEVNRWVRREWTGDYQHENSMDIFAGSRRREDWVRWDLISYSPTAGPAG